jgi:uncharacterized RDD family membrane protein YckC
MAALADAVNPYAAQVAGERLATGVARYKPTLASRSSRLGARIVDMALNLVVLIPGFAVAALTEEDSSRSSNDDLVSGVMVIAFLALNIYQWVSLARSGQTLGKKAMEIKVVMYHDWSNPGFGRAVVVRNWVNILLVLSFLLFYGLIDVLLIFGKDRRCIHDHIAGTVVIDVS